MNIKIRKGYEIACKYKGLLAILISCIVLFILFPIPIISIVGYLAGSYSERAIIWLPSLIFYIFFCDNPNKALRFVSYFGFAVFAAVIVEYSFAITNGLVFMNNYEAGITLQVFYRGFIASVASIIILSSILILKSKKLKILASVLSLALIRLIVMEVMINLKLDGFY